MPKHPSANVNCRREDTRDSPGFALVEASGRGLSGDRAAGAPAGLQLRLPDVCMSPSRKPPTESGQLRRSSVQV